jgi:uncharacterized membrane protein YfhO
MKENFFETISEKKGAYICLSLLFLLCFFVFKDFVLLHNAYLYKDVASDSINASYAQFLNISEYISREGFPKWCFNNGVGQNIFALILRDPTDLFVYLLGRDSIAYAIIFKELFKIMGSGFVFYLYLRKLSLSTYTSLIGAMLYTFTGFMILGSGWYIFTFEALILASLLYSFEKIFQDNSWYLFPILIALIGISMPFNLYLYGLFLFVYILFRYFLEKGMEVKGLFILLSKLGLLLVLGLGISAMFLFSNIKQLLESPRVAGDVTYFDTLSHFPFFGLAESENYATTILRFFSSDILGTGLNYKGWSNYLEAPLFYCGLLTLLLIPQVFGFLNKKQKIVYGIFIGVWLLPIIFPFFRYAFWLFTGDYYRGFSLCVDTAFIFIGLHALNHINQSRKINLTVLIITVVGLLVFLYYPYHLKPEAINSDLRATARNFLIVYAVLIYLHSIPKAKIWIPFALIFVVFVELSYFSYVTVNKRTVITSKDLKHKVGFNDYSTDAIAYLEKTDNSFYRIDKNYSSSLAYNGGLNDPQAQYYKGTGCYNSFNQKYYVYFLNAANVTNPNKDKAELESRRIIGFVNRPLLESLFSVKYVMSKQPDNSFLYVSHDSIAQFGDVKLFKKKFNLPLGFTYNKYILASDFAKLPDLQKDIALFKTIVVKDQDENNYKNFARFNIADTVNGYSWEAYSKDIEELKKDTLIVTNHNHNTIKGKITIDTRKLLFYSIPYDIGWTATVDGKTVPIEIVDLGLIGLFLDKGEHVIELNYTVPYLNTGILISCISILIFLVFLFISKKKKLDTNQKPLPN